MTLAQKKETGIIRITSGNRISLPSAIMPKDIAGFQFQLQKDGSILLIPLCTIPASQRYFWTRRWQEGEREANAAAASGKTIRYKKVGDLLRKIGE